MQQENHFYNHLWFVWILLTMIYLIGFYPTIHQTSFVLIGTLGEYFSRLTSLIGLFVPFGLFNTLESFYSGKAFFTFSLLIISLFCADFIALKMQIVQPIKRLVFNLVWLLLLTMTIDFIIYGQWKSPSFVETGADSTSTFTTTYSDTVFE